MFGSQGGCLWSTTEDLFSKGAWTPHPLTGRVIASAHLGGLTSGSGALLAGTVQPWLTRPLAVRQRRERLGTSSLLVLMVVTTQHSLKEAARVSGLPPSLCSNMWPSHSKVALTTLESLSKNHARPCAQALERVKGLPWTLGLFLASTLQHRASLPPENTPTFQPGNG